MPRDFYGYGRAQVAERVWGGRYPSRTYANAAAIVGAWVRFAWLLMGRLLAVVRSDERERFEHVPGEGWLRPVVRVEHQAVQRFEVTPRETAGWVGLVWISDRRGPDGVGGHAW